MYIMMYIFKRYSKDSSLITYHKLYCSTQPCETTTLTASSHEIYSQSQTWNKKSKYVGHGQKYLFLVHGRVVNFQVKRERVVKIMTKIRDWHFIMEGGQFYENKNNNKLLLEGWKLKYINIGWSRNKTFFMALNKHNTMSSRLNPVLILNEWLKWAFINFKRAFRCNFSSNIV